jgi:hypothetical protein
MPLVWLSRLGRGLPRLQGSWSTPTWRSVKDPIGLAMAEQDGSTRADARRRSASVVVLINEGWKAELPA